MFTIMVTGSRHHTDAALISYVLTAVSYGRPEGIHLIHGGAPGADTLAGEWAKYCPSVVHVSAFKADWDTYGKSAGPRRNQEMVDAKPDLVVGFPQGEARGTRDALRRALAAGISGFVVQSVADFLQ